MQSGELSCLRDIEKLVMSLSVNYAIARTIAADVFAEFGRFFVLCLRETAQTGALAGSELGFDSMDEEGGVDAYFASLDARMSKYIALVDRANWIEAAATGKRHGLYAESNHLLMLPFIANHGTQKHKILNRVSWIG